MVAAESEISAQGDFLEKLPLAAHGGDAQLVPPRSTPMEKSGMAEKITRTARERPHFWHVWQ